MQEIIDKHIDLVRSFNAIAAKLGAPPYAGRMDAAGDDLVITEDGLVKLPGEKISEAKRSQRPVF